MASQEWLWSNSSRKSVRCCGKVPLNGVNAVSLQATKVEGGGVRGRFAGLRQCANAHVCPVCSSVINAGRADEVARALTKWREVHPGGSVAFLTLTMRHQQGDSLADLWDALSYAWGRVTGGKAWVNDQTRYGLGGWVRVVETTHGTHGWHIHIHAALLSDKPLDQEALTSLGDSVWRRWEAGLKARDLSALKGPGVDIRRGYGNSGLARYFTKAANVGLASELTQGNAKESKNGNRTPFAILADLSQGVPGTEAYDRDECIWREWEQASRNRRTIAWSGRLRDDLGLEQERTDEELARDLEEEVKPETVLLIDAEDWKQLRARRGGRSQVLETLETQGVAAVAALLDGWGIRWRPPNPFRDEPPWRPDNAPPSAWSLDLSVSA